MLISLVLLAQLALSAPADSVLTGAQHPAYASDGRLTVGVRGDLWLRTGTRWTKLTSGPAWDSDPVWTTDGRAIVYATNATGHGDLYRIAIGTDGSAGAAERLTTSPERDAEPSVSSAGAIVFVRGTGNQARLWLRSADGGEKRVTKGNDAERWPAWSPDGTRIAYSATREDRTRLRLRYVAGDSDRVVVEDRDAEHAAWSPTGDRIAFATRNGRAGVWVTTPDARYVNLASTRRAEPAWSPDARTLALVELPGADVGYNGDPDRVGDRTIGDPLMTTGRLWIVDAPAPLDARDAAVALAVGDRRRQNGDAFASVWARMDSLYFRRSAEKHREWLALRTRFESRALAAASDTALDVVLQELLHARPTLRDAATGRAAVSSAHPVATAAGVEMLRRGGNVVDAAVAVSFALGVVEPDASGLGGYGQMLVSLRSMARPALIEFMTRAPEEASLANGALLRRGTLPNDGPVLVNVPGTLAGMELAWKKYGSGKLQWADVIAPAIRAADSGYVVSEGLATTLATERAHFLLYPGSRALFFRDGQPLHAGDSLRNPDLARTLRLIADSGAAAFYRGDIAQRLVADLRGRGNAMRLTDLARYYAAEREPVQGSYRGYTLFSSAPPASGGPTLVSQLNMLEQRAPLRDPASDATSLHAMIEAWKLVPASRGRIADPGLWPVQIDAFVNKDSSHARWSCFSAARALTPDDIRNDSLPCAKGAAGAKDAKRVSLLDTPSEAGGDGVESVCSDHDAFASERFCHRTGTTAFAVGDADGNAVAVTQTLGTWGGNFYVTPGLGFLYNDKLGSYGNDPDEYGARLPGARHGSTLAPTIVFRGEGSARRPVLAAGAAGNAWITSAVYSIVTGVLDQHLDVQHAIEQPRFLIGQQRGAVRPEYLIQVEDGFDPGVMRALEGLGHRFQPISLRGELRMGYGAAVTFGERTVTAAADPRRAGEAGAVP